MAGGLYDFHSHILPGMDDGYPDAESAVEALKLSFEQGVRYVVATPHYYSEEPVDQFLQRRAEAMDRLCQAMHKDGGPFPEICLGAEVAYYPGISENKMLNQLCIGNSNYMLLEMPMLEWGIEVARDLQNMCNTGNVAPILAHIERYIQLLGHNAVSMIVDSELQLQMSAEFIMDRRTRRFAKQLLKGNPAMLLGTDCHNLQDRKPNMGPALQALQGRHMDWVVQQIMAVSEEIWNEAVGSGRLPTKEEKYVNSFFAS